MPFDSDCKICHKEVVRKKNKWLACERCRDWYHAACLGKVYEKSYTIFEEKNVLWLCDGCRSRTAQDWDTEEGAVAGKSVHSNAGEVNLNNLEEEKRGEGTDESERGAETRKDMESEKHEENDSGKTENGLQDHTYGGDVNKEAEKGKETTGGGEGEEETPDQRP